MNGKRTPAIYRLNDGEPPNRVTESLVWIVAAAPQVVSLGRSGDDNETTEPRHQLMALVVFGNGMLDLVPAAFLEVINWSDEDTALTMSLPPKPNRDNQGHIIHGNHTSCDIVQDNVVARRRIGRRS